MKYRKLGTTELSVSEVGFGVWSVSTGWWGKVDERQAVGLLTSAYDAGVTLFDTADTYGDGFGEEVLAKALGERRQDIVIATKFGYDIYSGGARQGHKERPQNFTPEFIRHACEQSLRRLKTDYIDLYQLHNPRLDAIQRDDVFDTLEVLAREGKVRHHGAAIGPDIGWFEEGEAAMRERHVPQMQIIYNLLEHEPARRFFPIAEEEKTGLMTRVPHASGLLDGTFTKNTVFEANDHRSHRKREWLKQGLKKVERLSFLTEDQPSTIGQIAIKFALAAPMVASVLPTITDAEQLREFAAASETKDIPEDSLQLVMELYERDFDLEPTAEVASGD